MTEVSARLRAARERAGLTIEDISASTKLPAATLHAIERGDFSKLPGDFYTRAFLRTYARELRLSPDDIVRDFDAGRQPAQQDHSDAESAEPIARRNGTTTMAARPASPGGAWPGIMAIAGSTGVVVAVLIVLLAVLVARNRPAAPPAGEPGAVATSGNVAAPPATSMGSAPRDERVDRLVIEIQAAAPIWVTGAADGKRVLYRLLAPGERVKVEARDEMAFRVGDAAAFTYTINGAAGKPVGGPGEVRDVHITRENHRTFVR